MDIVNQSYAYVTRDDLLDCYNDDTTLVLRCPEKMHLSVPLNKDEQGVGYNLKAKSQIREIDVRLLTRKGRSLVQRNTLQLGNTATIKREVTFYL